MGRNSRVQELSLSQQHSGYVWVYIWRIYFVRRTWGDLSVSFNLFQVLRWAHHTFALIPICEWISQAHIVVLCGYRYIGVKHTFLFWFFIVYFKISHNNNHTADNIINTQKWPLWSTKKRKFVLLFEKKKRAVIKRLLLL